MSNVTNISLNNKHLKLWKLVSIFSLAFMLAFSPVFAQQNIQEEEVKTEEKCLVGTSVFQTILPVNKQEKQRFSQVRVLFETSKKLIIQGVSKKYVLHCQWIFYE